MPPSSDLAHAVEHAFRRDRAYRVVLFDLIMCQMGVSVFLYCCMFHLLFYLNVISFIYTPFPLTGCPSPTGGTRDFKYVNF